MKCIDNLTFSCNKSANSSLKRYLSEPYSKMNELKNNSKLCGFLIGFFSQLFPNEGYVHFVGVDPNYRNVGLARTLYQKMGFSIEPGDSEIDGVPLSIDYLGGSDQKAKFKKVLKPG